MGQVGLSRHIQQAIGGNRVSVDRPTGIARRIYAFRDNVIGLLDDYRAGAITYGNPFNRRGLAREIAGNEIRP
jgi:hypothetical protein